MVGLPYGSRPRLILAHLNREALLHGSPRIEVENTLTGFIKRIVPGRSPNAREIGQFKDQLTRFAAATVRMAADLPDGRAYQVNTQIIDFMELWGGKDGRQRVLWPAVVELSPRYFDTLRKHAVPLDERAIGALANSPMALDTYAWLAQRLCRIRSRREQFSQLGWLQEQFGIGYGRIRDFRKHFRAILVAVHSQYRGAKFDLDDHGHDVALQPAADPRQYKALDHTIEPPEAAAPGVHGRPEQQQAMVPALPLAVEWAPKMKVAGYWRSVGSGSSS